MDLLTIFLSSFLAIVSPIGLILENVVESRLRSQLEAVDELKVRIDNAPNYQILQGKAQGIRVASRGVEPIPDLRIAVLEFETDPIDLNLLRLRQEEAVELQQPLQGGVRLVLTETDLNQALQSPRLQTYLQQRLSRLSTGLERYEVLSPRLDLLNRNRFRVQFQLQPPGKNPALTIVLESGIEVIAGSRFELLDPKGTIDGRPLSPRLLQGITQGLSDRLDLRSLEGMTLRLLQLEIDNDQISGAAFVRVETGTLNLSLN